MAENCFEEDKMEDKNGPGSLWRLIYKLIRDYYHVPGEPLTIDAHEAIEALAQMIAYITFPKELHLEDKID